MRHWTTIFLATSIVASGCASCGDEPPPEESEVPWAVIDAGTEPTETEVCDNGEPDGPIVALQWDETMETYLAPGSSPTSVAVDYDVVPAALVERLEVAVDFDPRLTGASPADPAAEPTVIDERCPDTVSLAPLTGATDQETVVTATVAASRADGSAARRGLVSLSTGTTETTLVTDRLDSGSEDSEWYFLFEPVGGIGRITLLPADLSRTTFTAPGIPDQTGVVALVQSDELRLDAANEVIYAPQSFGASWRQRVSGWYGRLRMAGEDPTTDYSVSEIVAPDQTDLAAAVSLNGDFRHEFDTASRLIVQTAAAEATGVMTFPCDRGALRVVSAGFVRAELDAGTPTTVGPGESTVLQPECQDADATVSITLQSMTQRSQAIVISPIAEESP